MHESVYMGVWWSLSTAQCVCIYRFVCVDVAALDEAALDESDLDLEAQD